MTTVNLKPINYHLVRGCPGLKETKPTIKGIFEYRNRESNNLPLLGSFKIQFVTVDHMKSKLKDIPQSKTLLNYELSHNFNERMGNMDVPFIIPIKDYIPPTIESTKSITEHYLKVEIILDGTLKSFEFPVLIETYDTFPLHNNQPISRSLVSKDSLISIDYSIASNSISPNEELKLKLNITGNKSKLSIKKLDISILEIFECRGDKWFTEDKVLNSKTVKLEHKLDSPFIQTFELKPTPSISAYDLFLSQQNQENLIPTNNLMPKNELRPIIVDYHADRLIPFTHHAPMTFNSVLVSYRYELKVAVTYGNRTSHSVRFQQPFIICPFDKRKSLKMYSKLIQKEEENARRDLVEFDKHGGLGYDERFKVLKYPQPKAIILNR